MASKKFEAIAERMVAVERYSAWRESLSVEDQHLSDPRYDDFYDKLCGILMRTGCDIKRACKYRDRHNSAMSQLLADRPHPLDWRRKTSL